METRAHLNLKRLALSFLRSRGCEAVATEVRCPISRYRVDVAGFLDRRPDARTQRTVRCEARTVFVECKQTRADFLRDQRDLDRLLRRRRALERFRASIEEHRIKRFEPHLRRSGSSLFPELDEWDFAESRLASYHQVLRRLRRLDEQIHGQTKFCMIARYGLADRMFVAAPTGLIRRRELPLGWGLLEIDGRWLDHAHEGVDLFGECTLRVAVNAPAHRPRPEFRDRMLRNIAVAAGQSVSVA